MKKTFSSETADELRKEYDLASLRGGVRGKYHRRAVSGTNLVLIDVDLSSTFPDSESVNRALRLLVETARASTPKRGKRKAS